MTGRTQERTKPERAYERACCRRSFPAFADAGRRLRNRPSIPSPRFESVAWQRAEDDAKHRNVLSTHSLRLQPEAWRTTCYGSTAVWLRRHPYIGALQTSVSIERQFSRIFPAHPRSLARCLSRARRHGAALLRLRRPQGFRFSENLVCDERKKIFRTFRKRRRLALGAGHTRVASRKSVPRALRANTNKEKNNGTLRKQNHFERLSR